MKKALALAMTVILLVMLAGCGEKEPEKDPFIGTFGGTASYFAEVELVIKEDNTVTYKDEMQFHEGTWSKRDDGSIELDFDGKIFGRLEPMIATLSDDENSITVIFSEDVWDPCVHQRQSS